MPKYWFDHIHVVSSDPMKTAKFYEQALGAKNGGLRKLPDGVLTVDLDLNGTSIRIRQPRAKPLLAGAPVTDGVEHLGMRTDNIEAAVPDLKAKGARIVQEIQYHADHKAAFFVAPEGVLIELDELTGPSGK